MRSELTSAPPDYILTKAALAFVFGAVSQTRHVGTSVSGCNLSHGIPVVRLRPSRLRLNSPTVPREPALAGLLLTP